MITLADARGAAKISPRWRHGPWEVAEGSAGAPIADAPGADAISLDENEPAVIIFTSGTEGRAKAVVLAHRSLLAAQQMLLHVTRRLPYQPDETAARSACIPVLCSTSVPCEPCCGASRWGTRW